MKYQVVSMHSKTGKMIKHIVEACSAIRAVLDTHYNFVSIDTTDTWIDGISCKVIYKTSMRFVEVRELKE